MNFTFTFLFTNDQLKAVQLQVGCLEILEILRLLETAVVITTTYFRIFLPPAPRHIKVPWTVSGRKKSSEWFSIAFYFIALTNLFLHFEPVDSQQQDHFACHFR